MNKQTVRFPNCLSIWTNLMIFVENVWLEFDLFLLFFFPFLGLFASNRNRTACLSLYLEWVNWFYFAFFRWINLVGFFASSAADIIIQCEVPCTQTLIHCLVDRYSLLLLFGLFIHSFARSFVRSFLFSSFFNTLQMIFMTRSLRLSFSKTVCTCDVMRAPISQRFFLQIRSTHFSTLTSALFFLVNMCNTSNSLLHSPPMSNKTIKIDAMTTNDYKLSEWIVTHFTTQWLR